MWPLHLYGVCRLYGFGSITVCLENDIVQIAWEGTKLIAQIISLLGPKNYRGFLVEHQGDCYCLGRHQKTLFSWEICRLVTVFGWCDVLAQLKTITINENHHKYTRCSSSQCKYHSRQAMLCCNHRIAVHEVPLETEHGVKPVVFGRKSCCFDIYI